MGQIKVHCESCGGDWIVYHRSVRRDKPSRTCPGCGKSIDPETWERKILKAVEALDDANAELVRDRGSLFTVSYIPDVFFENRDASEIVQLREDIDNLRQIVRRLIDGVFSE